MTEFGLYLPQVGLGFGQIVEAASAAASFGFRHIWFIDHFEIPGYAGVMEGWTVATAVAAAVPGIRVGHLMLCAGVRHPSLLGKMAATLDRISDGRLDLGLGWGSSPEELRAFGVSTEPGATRRAKLVETIAIVRSMLTGGEIDFEGEHYTVRATCSGPTAVQSPVPLFIGGTGPATMELVRDYADWWNCPSAGRKDLSTLVPAAGRARVSANYSLAIEDESSGTVRLSGRPYAPVLLGGPAAIADALVADGALGVELFNIQFVRIGQLMQQMETFMGEVAPAVA
ncbi:MAG TPA: LLM class flavin-dependent oxidoreductase [Acidimicrobiales bacterium]|nr:LLM class flavin-dependent oxidoreductase [Acidimicrobiales bacterium]